jgi:hypothetical protein
MKYFKKYIYLFSLILIVGGCEKFVAINPPKTSLVSDKVFASNETATSALLSIYGLMVSGDVTPFRISLSTGLTGDELKNYSGGDLQQLYTNAISSTDNNYTRSIWIAAYNFIYRANTVYEGCNLSNSLDPDVKKQLMAEALFIRAYWHFYLVNLYGDIPLITTSDYSVNAIAKRIPNEQVYAQIITDLKEAKNNLREDYVGANSLNNSTERIRPNKYAASALLARVYLYESHFTEAEKEASEVIEKSELYSLVSLNNVFLRNSGESIWQLMMITPATYNTFDGYGFILTSTPESNSQTTISSQLMSTFEDGDLRKSAWIGKYTDETVTPNVDYYFPYKYKVKSGSVIIENSMMLRLAELYLIRAESRNEQNNPTGAIEDLNKLRDRSRGPVSIDTPNPLPALLTTLNKDQVKTAILHERQVELFTEQGHRWLDLKRTKIVDNVMNNVTPLKGGVWKSEKQLWPIPKSEILSDQNLIQNPGYN